MRSQIAEGWRYVWRHPYLRPIAYCTGSSNLFSQMAFSVVLIFAVRELHMSAGLIGLVFAIGNVRFLLGAFVANRIAKRLGIGPTIVGSAMLFGLAWIPIPLATRATAVPLLILALTIGGFGGVIYNINQVSLRQAITPERMQGRMNATMRFMVWGTIPIGAFTGGVLGNTIGLRPTLWVGAIGSLFSFLPPLLSAVRGLERIPDAPAEPPPGSGDEGLMEPGHLPAPAPSAGS